MPKLTYPIVFVFNEETKCHNGYIPDLAIFADGQTPEDVYAEMETILKNFLHLSIKYNTDIPAPRTLDEVVMKWPGFKVSLISAEVR